MNASEGVGYRSFDLDRPRPVLLQTSLEFVAGVAAIGKDIAQLRIAGPDLSQDIRRAVAILNVCGMHDEPDHSAEHIDQDVAFASVDFVACIVSTKPTTLGRLDALTIDVAEGRVSPPDIEIAQAAISSRA